jgi:chromosome segregation ATPase
VTALERQRQQVHALKAQLEKLEREERTGETKVREQEREVSREVSSAEHDAREAKEALERLRDEYADILTELGSLSRKRDALKRSSHSDEVGTKSKVEAEKRTLARLAAEEAKIESEDRASQTEVALEMRALETEKRTAEHTVSRPGDGNDRALDSEARKDQSAISVLRHEIDADQAEIRMLMERIKEKETRLRALEVRLTEIEAQRRSSRGAGHKTDPTVTRRISAKQENIEHLEVQHKEFTGRIRELTDEIREHKEILDQLMNSSGRSSTDSTSQEVERKIAELEQRRGHLEPKLRDAENLVTHHSGSDVTRKKETVQGLKRKKEDVAREKHTTEEALRTAERDLAAAEKEVGEVESKAEEITERARNAALRKREQDEKKRKLTAEISELDGKITALRRSVA